jgi:hypothetical protein
MAVHAAGRVPEIMWPKTSCRETTIKASDDYGGVSKAEKAEYNSKAKRINELETRLRSSADRNGSLY